MAAEERWNKTRQKIERAGERNSVAGYDLTFSAPKSVSVLWASAPDKDAQRTVRAAHHEGIRAAMAVLERDGSFVRRGRNGVRQEQVSGVLAAAFDHRTSRSGDPQLHTHVAVLAMAKTGDRRVLALDGRAIYGLSGALSAIYDFHRDKALMRDLNVRLEVCERTGVREIAGVPDSLQALWSTRRAQITPRVEELKAQYLATHGREAPPEMVAKMAQWATLDTRPAKGEPESTEALFARWRQAALAVGRHRPGRGVVRGDGAKVAGPDDRSDRGGDRGHGHAAPGDREGVMDRPQPGAGDLAGDGTRPAPQRRGGPGPGRALRGRRAGPPRRVETDPVAGAGPARRAGAGRRRSRLPGAQHRSVRHPLGDLRGAVSGGPPPIQHRHPGPDGAHRSGHRRGRAAPG